MIAADRFRAAIGDAVRSQLPDVVRVRLESLYLAMIDHRIADPRLYSFCTRKALPYVGRYWADPHAPIDPAAEVQA
jgi:hypothetical protein